MLIALGITECVVRYLASEDTAIRYLATSGKRDLRQHYSSLEGYLHSRRDQIVPYRNWHNYWTNALGFNDVEFSEVPIAGVTRILALGDSFCYGLVPYPQNVITIFEEELGRLCGRKFEVFNLGIGGSGVWDYTTIFRLTSARFKPERVLVHIYLGNDPPDLLRGWSDLPGDRARSFHLYVWSLLRNWLRLRQGLASDRPELESQLALLPKGATPPNGGMVADGSQELPNDEAKNFAEPTFSESAYDKVLSDELGRFLRVSDPVSQTRWRAILQTLKELVDSAKLQGIKPTLVLFPSRMQIYPEEARTALTRLVGQNELFQGKSYQDFDFDLPNRELISLCKSEQLDCVDLTDVFRRVATTSSQNPYIPRDTHWRISGNSLAGRAQAEALAPLLCPN